VNETKAIAILNEPETKTLMGRASKAAIKQAFDDAGKPDLPSLLGTLRGACRKRQDALKTQGLLSDDERAYLAGLLTDLEQTQATIKGLLNESPVMATDAEKRRAMTGHLKNQFRLQQMSRTRGARG